MYVGLKMLKDFYRCTPETLVKDAQRQMEDHNLWMLLVMEGEKLQGYVRKEDIMAALPSMMTSLSRHEVNYLLSRLKVKKLVRKDMVTVSPELEIEAAAHLMWEKNLAGLAVVDYQGHLLGYINRNVMLQVFVEEMGYDRGGSRIVFEVLDRAGVLKEISGLIADLGFSIISTGTYFHRNMRLVVIRVDTDDPSIIAARMQDLGYKLVSATDFMDEWQ
ncbi:MAG: CBS domain-containing protein [Desulfonatronovibrionaceae bacterium]